jgi:DNA-binding transcriptional MerR regulator
MSEPQATQGRRKAPPPAITATPKRAGAYLTIAEMAAELGVATHVLRFWESKFPQLQPLKQQGGRRFYNPETACVARHIKELLYTQKLTIKGAQAALGKQKPKAIAAKVASHLAPDEIVKEIKDIMRLLDGSTQSQTASQA